MSQSSDVVDARNLSPLPLPLGVHSRQLAGVNGLSMHTWKPVEVAVAR